MGALWYSLATSVVACLVTRALVSVLIPVVSCSSYRHGQGSDSYSGTVYLVSFPPCVFVSHSSLSVFLALCILCPFPPVSLSLTPRRRCSCLCVLVFAFFVLDFIPHANCLEGGTTSPHVASSAFVYLVSVSSVCSVTAAMSWGASLLLFALMVEIVTCTG